MKKAVTLLELSPFIRSVLDSGEEYTFSPSGNSMRPMLYGNKCTVTLIKPRGRLKKYDLPLYQTDDRGLIMHRVIEVREDCYTMRGDCVVTKEEGITDSQIIGVVQSFTRNGKKYGVDSSFYRIYCFIWTSLPLLRRFIMKFGKKQL